MADGRSIGTVFAELDLDPSRYTKAQQKLYKDATQTALGIEENFKKLGIKSSAEFDLMRQKASNAFEGIKNSHKATANDIMRAEQAKADAIKRINEQQFGHQTTLIEGLKKNWIAATVAIGAAMVVMNKAWNLADQSAKFEQQKIAFNNLAASYNTSADQIIASLKRTSGETIATQILIEKAGTAMMMGINPEKISKLMEIARATSKMTGQSVTEAFDNISLAVGRQSKMILDNLGIIVSAGDANEQYAKELGKSAEQLTDTERKTAFLNATIVAGEDLMRRLGEQTDTTRDKMDRLRATIADLKITLGEGIIRAGAGAMGVFQATSAAALALASSIYTIIGGINTLISHLPGTDKKKWQANADEWKRGTEAAIGASMDLWDKAGKNFNVMFSSAGAISGSSVRQIPGGQEDNASAGKADTAEALKEAQKLHEFLVDLYIKDEARKWEALEKYYEEMEKASEDYRKMVSEEQSFSVNKHESAMLKIIANEENKLLAAKKMLDERKITEDQFANYEILVQQNTTLAIKDLNDKELRDSLSLLEQLGSGYQSEYDRLFELTVKSEADILEVKMKALNIYFDKAKWINDQLVGRYANEFQDKISQISEGFGQLENAFSSIASLYKEGSKDAERWTEAAKAMEIAQRALAVVTAVVGIATQASGDPYTAFVRVAAMAAAMGALMASIGESVGGVSAAGPAVASSRSTVLGAEAGTASESIANSLSILEDTYDMSNLRLTAIYNEIRDLNDNITGLVTSLVRSGNFEGVDTVTTASPYATNSIVQGIGGAWGGNLIDMLPNSPLKSILGAYKYVDPLAGSISLLPEILGAVLGGETKTYNTAKGLTIGKTTAGDIMGGQNLNVQNWKQLATKTSGGWFDDDEWSVANYYSKADQSITQLFTLVYKNLSSSLMYIAQELGSNTKSVLDYVFKDIKLNLINMSTEEINTKITDYINNLSDKAVEKLFGGLISQYQQLNEGLLETAIRLIAQKETISKILEMTNQTFDGTTSQFIKFSDSLVKVAGSLDKLTDAFSTYYDAFFSDAEKQADYKKQLQSVLGSYGYSLPTDRAGYRDIVEGINLSTEAGMQAYYAMLATAETADKYYDYLEQAKGNVRPESYSTNLEYQRALAGLPKYADGGIASGPMTGYAATLHGTELVISPRKSYPATVKGESYAELIDEVKSLREEVASMNRNVTANTYKTANNTEYLETWDTQGLPT